MSTKIKNYNKELKSALSALVDLAGSYGMHWALITADYENTEDVSDKVLVDLINNYISLSEMNSHILNNLDNFENDFNGEEDEF